MDLAIEKIDRIEHHLKLIKDEQKETNVKTNEILSCLIGNVANGNTGLVHNVQKLDKKICDLEHKVNEHNYTIIQLKYVTGVLFVAFLGVALKLIFKL